MEEEISRAYILVDSVGRVVQIEGEYTLSMFEDISRCILVEQGHSCDRLNHAQSHYLKNGLIDVETGKYNYKYENGSILERSPEEKEAD